VDGHPVRFTGEILFHFENLREEEWRERMRSAPPDID
jgi:hypothetical protein